MTCIQAPHYYSETQNANIIHLSHSTAFCWSLCYSTHYFAIMSLFSDRLFQTKKREKSEKIFGGSRLSPRKSV